MFCIELHAISYDEGQEAAGFVLQFNRFQCNIAGKPCLSCSAVSRFLRIFAIKWRSCVRVPRRKKSLTLLIIDMSRPLSISDGKLLPKNPHCSISAPSKLACEKGITPSSGSSSTNQ
ncbi:hypothetical protein TWF970_011606 [Orbilia oligospora]|uniref:Uncharacterized protein n=1 Tax=Orbilia oligospora TaxID=2813651 RepID=A0A7C8VR37_ORBOL|nr:hypothetical protein TWF970_011606 [Orbilia oligospora]